MDQEEWEIGFSGTFQDNLTFRGDNFIVNKPLTHFEKFSKIAYNELKAVKFASPCAMLAAPCSVSAAICTMSATPCTVSAAAHRGLRYP